MGGSNSALERVRTACGKPCEKRPAYSSPAIRRFIGSNELPPRSTIDCSGWPSRPGDGFTGPSSSRLDLKGIVSDHHVLPKVVDGVGYAGLVMKQDRIIHVTNPNGVMVDR